MELDVTYVVDTHSESTGQLDDSSSNEVDGEPQQIEYHHMVYGLVRFDVEGETAVVDDSCNESSGQTRSTLRVEIGDEWNEVRHDTLKDGFEPQVETGDVIDEVRKLPFVESVWIGDDDGR